MRKLTYPTLTLALGVRPLLSATRWSVDIQKGVYAYERTSYAAAPKEWNSMAWQGVSKTQYWLGEVNHKEVMTNTKAPP